MNAAQRPTNDNYNRYISLIEEAKALKWEGKSVARQLSFRVYDVGIQSILLRADLDLAWLATQLGLEADAKQLMEWYRRGCEAFTVRYQFCSFVDFI